METKSYFKFSKVKPANIGDTFYSFKKKTVAKKLLGKCESNMVSGMQSTCYKTQNTKLLHTYSSLNKIKNDCLLLSPTSGYKKY